MRSSHPPDEVLARQHVIKNVFSIPPDSKAHSGSKVFWINTINDLMSIKPSEDLMLPYFYPNFDEDGEPIDRKCRFPSMVIRNIDLLQKWYRTVDDPHDIRIW
jgi:hypothetical protein